MTYPTASGMGCSSTVSGTLRFTTGSEPASASGVTSYAVSPQLAALPGQPALPFQPLQHQKAMEPILAAYGHGIIFLTLISIVLTSFIFLAPVTHASMVITCQRAGNISQDFLQNSCLIEDSQRCFGQPVIDNLTDSSLSFQSIHGTLLKDSLTPDGLTDREYLDHEQYQSSPVVAVSEKGAQVRMVRNNPEIISRFAVIHALCELIGSTQKTLDLISGQFFIPAEQTFRSLNIPNNDKQANHSGKVPEASTSKLLTAIPFSALALALTYASISHSPEYKIPKVLAHAARAAAMHYAMTTVIDFDTETPVQKTLSGIGSGILQYAIATEVLCIATYLDPDQVPPYDVSDFDLIRDVHDSVNHGIAEEIMYRDILQNSLDLLFDEVLGYFEVENKIERAELASSLLSSSLFAAVHLGSNGHSSLTIVITGYLGYILGDIYRRHGLLSAMSFHSFFNLAGVALSLTYLKWSTKIRQDRQ